jgi:hypothetical protein
MPAGCAEPESYANGSSIATAMDWHPTVARPMAATSVSWSMVEWQVMVSPRVCL